jgi:hypothetical protein
MFEVNRRICVEVAHGPNNTHTRAYEANLHRSLLDSSGFSWSGFDCAKA